MYIKTIKNEFTTFVQVFFACKLRKFMELKVGFEPTRAKPTAYKTVPIDHYGTSAYIAKAQTSVIDELNLPHYKNILLKVDSFTIVHFHWRRYSGLSKRRELTALYWSAG